jgi:hypothetical protein
VTIPSADMPYVPWLTPVILPDAGVA